MSFDWHDEKKSRERYRAVEAAAKREAAEKAAAAERRTLEIEAKLQAELKAKERELLDRIFRKRPKPAAKAAAKFSALKTWRELVAAARARGLSPADAVRHVAKQRPRLRELMLLEANRGR